MWYLVGGNRGKFNTPVRFERKTKRATTIDNPRGKTDREHPFLIASLTLLLLNHRVVSVGMVGQALISSRSFLSNTSVCSEEKHARLEKDLGQRGGRKRHESITHQNQRRRASGVTKHDERASGARSSRGSEVNPRGHGTGKDEAYEKSSETHPEKLAVLKPRSSNKKRFDLPTLLSASILVIRTDPTQTEMTNRCIPTQPRLGLQSLAVACVGCVRVGLE